jgi:transposase-like protein
VGPKVSISSTQISRCAEKLDAGLEAWRNHPLDETPYLLPDTRYERVREAGQVVDCVVFVAVGVTASGHRRMLGLALEGWRKERPELSAWAEVNLTEGFAVFALPPEHRVRMRTTNGVKRLNKVIKRRTRVATLFPNSASCLRLVSAILAEQDEEWMTAKIYQNMTP